jgi:N-acetylglucosamine-6-phosphate deacetylase
VTNQKIITADRIFTGESWLDDHAVIIENGRIADIQTSSSLSPGKSMEKFDGCFLAPAFIDLQI